MTNTVTESELFFLLDYTDKYNHKININHAFHQPQNKCSYNQFVFTCFFLNFFFSLESSIKKDTSFPESLSRFVSAVPGADADLSHIYEYL